MSYALAKTKHENDQEEGGPLPCHRCDTATPRKILAVFGAMCGRCYDAYCAERHPLPNTGDIRSEGPRAWAHALKTREESGERLTSPQKAMWRAALGVTA